MFKRKNLVNKGGTKPLVHLLPMMALLVFGMITLVGVVSADSVYNGAPPVTKFHDTVNGGVNVLMNYPADTWNLTAPGREEQKCWGNMTLLFEDNTTITPNNVEMKLARLYVVVYGGNMSENYTGNMSVDLYKDNTYISTLVTGQELNLPYNNASVDYNKPAYNTSVVFPLVNLSRVTSDYIAVFDIKDNISSMDSDNLNVRVTTYNVTGKFDARVKTVQLVYAYNDTNESTGETTYWINEGHDPMTKYVSSNTCNMTWFNDTGIASGDEYSATLWVDYLAGIDGTYKWNGTSFTPTNQIQWKYAGLNRLMWSGTPGMLDDNYLEYARGSNSWYKMNFAVLAIE